MELNDFRLHKLDELLARCDITDLKVVSMPAGRVTRIDVEFVPKEEAKYAR